MVVHGFGRQIDFGKRLGHLEQQPLAGQRFINRRQSLFLAAGEVVKDVLHVDREAGQISGKILGQVVRPLDQFIEGILRRVVKVLPGGSGQQVLAHARRRGFIFFRILMHHSPGRLQHAIQAAQQGERQDHVFVILGVVVILDEIGDFPQEFSDFGVVLHEFMVLVTGQGYGLAWRYCS